MFVVYSNHFPSQRNDVVVQYFGVVAIDIHDDDLLQALVIALCPCLDGLVGTRCTLNRRVVDVHRAMEAYGLAFVQDAEEGREVALIILKPCLNHQ